MTQYLSTDKEKVTTRKFIAMKGKQKIAMLTAYDYTTALLLDAGGIDAILVGDSAANVVCGYENTLPIHIDEMIFLAKSVRRAVKHALVVCDMPFGSYQESRERAVHNAVRIMKETGVDAVKIEGGEYYLDTITAIIQAGIPVMGHLGLMPQSVHQYGGYALRAKEYKEVKQLLSDAVKLCDAGCFAITLEKIPADVAAQVTSSVSCPTIGIGAGSCTDGQILVGADMLGLSRNFQPKFLRRYAQVGDEIEQAVKHYVADVREGLFPTEQESY